MTDQIKPGDHVRALCPCHDGQAGIVKEISADGTVISIELPGDSIALPVAMVAPAKVAP